MEFYTDLFIKNRYMRYVAPEVIRDECLKMAERDIAYVTIEIPVTIVTKYTRDVNFTFLDKLSALGW